MISFISLCRLLAVIRPRFTIFSLSLFFTFFTSPLSKLHFLCLFMEQKMVLLLALVVVMVMSLVVLYTKTTVL